MRALWSDRQNCSHNVSQQVERVRCFSELFFEICLSARFGWGFGIENGEAGVFGEV